MSVIPCEKNERLTVLIEDYAEVLKTEAHKLGTHGLDEQEFYNSGVFRGAIERVRGQFSATMRMKREFVHACAEPHAGPGLHPGVGFHRGKRIATIT